MSNEVTKRTQFTTRMEERVLEAAKQVAKRYRWPVNTYIQLAVEERLAQDGVEFESDAATG